NYFHLTSHGDELNGAVIPIDDLRAHGEISQNHHVLVDSGAELKAARDVNLIAERYSNAEIIAYGEGKNWMTALASAIDSLFGSDGISEEFKGGSIVSDLAADVTVDGSIEVGILKDQELIIGKDFILDLINGNQGTVLSQTDGISYTIIADSMAQSLFDEYQHWNELKVEYAGDPASEAAYQQEIDRVVETMKALGMYDYGDDPNDPRDDSIVVDLTPYIVLDDIWAQAGLIRVQADNFYSNSGGDLLAPGDVNVNIINRSPAGLRVNKITIPDNAGGRVFYNGADIVTAADIADVNLVSGPTNFASIVVADPTGTLDPQDPRAPKINIESTFSADLPENINDPLYQDFITPDIEIKGDINNILGSVTISSEGSVLASANINAGHLAISAGRDFVLSYTDDALFSVGGNPGTHWQGVANITEDLGKAGSLPSYVADGAFTPDTDDERIENAITSTLADPTDGFIIAANNVSITAKYLNINGLIQSGMPERNVTISTAMESKIAKAEEFAAAYRSGDYSAYKPTQTGGIFGIIDLIGALLHGDIYYFNKAIAAEGLSTNDYVYYKLPTEGNIDVYWNSELDRLELEAIRVEGGYVEVFGEIMNTSQGQIKVLDGYGQIHVNNQTGYDLVTNEMDTGRGVEGRLKITDTLITEADGSPLVTEYWRENGQVYKITYYQPDAGETASVFYEGQDPDGAARTATYQPDLGSRYYWQTGQNFILKTTTTYGQSSLWGIDFLAPDPGTIVSGPNREDVDPRPLNEGEFIEDEAQISPYTYTFTTFQTSEPVHLDPEKWTTSTWYGKKTYYLRDTVVEGRKDIHTHSIRADRAIGIEFIGFDFGDPSIGLSITTGGDLLLQGNIKNEQGNTALAAGDAINLLNEDVVIGGANITLNAVNGIGGNNTLVTNLTNGANGVLNAITTRGDIKIEELSGELKIGQVTTSNANGDVTLFAKQDIIGSDTANLVRGGAITLTSQFGSIGDIDGPTVNIDTGNSERDVLNASAIGDVALKETSGDLKLESIGTFGDVYVEVAAGTLVDSNTAEVRDPRTEQQLNALWDSMNATAATVNISKTATLDAYQGIKSREYHAYWRYRQQQTNDIVGGLMHAETYYVVVDATDPNKIYLANSHDNAIAAEPILVDISASTQTGAGHVLSGSAVPVTFDSMVDVDSDNNAIALAAGHGLNTGDAVNYYRTVAYDSGYVVMLSAAENDFYTEFYTTEGEDLGLSGAELDAYVSGAITTLVNKRTQEYHTAHKTYGNLPLIDSNPDIYDPAWSYDVTDATLHQSFGAVQIDAGDFSIDIGAHVLNTGQAVVYHANGGSIAGLVDGETYYVVVDDVTPNRVKLALTQADANAGIVIELDPLTAVGTDHQLSDGDVLTQRAEWSESKLKNSINTNILRPKTTSGTTITIEEANISGDSVTIKVANNIGRSGDTITVVMPITDTISDEAKFALAAAEGDDIKFYADLAGTIEVQPDDEVEIKLIKVDPKDDVDLTVQGILNVIAGNSANLGSEQTIYIDQVSAGGEVRIKVQKGLYDGRTDTMDPVNIRSANLILEAEEESIGQYNPDTDTIDYLIIDTSAGATLTARANNNIYIIEDSGDLRINEVFSNDFVDIRADGSILDAADDDPSVTILDWDIKTNVLYLQAGAGGTIGADGQFLETDLQGGVFDALAGQSIFVNEVLGDMRVSEVRSNSGDVSLTAHISILDTPDTSGVDSNPLADVIGNSIILNAVGGTIGSFGDDLDINSSNQAFGTLTSSSELNTYIIETELDLNLNTVATNAGTAFI
ncbi:MAG: hypothetical protein AMJ53_16125, partial [Gammaproteobacteria bacterium SG8_11]